MVCCHCGRELSEELHFCPFCGGKDPLGIYSELTDEGPMQPEDEPELDSIADEQESDPEILIEPIDTVDGIADSVSDDLIAEETVSAAVENDSDDSLDMAVSDDDAPFLEESEVNENVKKEKKVKKPKAEKAQKPKQKSNTDLSAGERPPRKKVKAGTIILAIFIIAALAVGGYFAYITWFSSEARFSFAMEKGLASMSEHEYMEAVEHYSKAIDIDSTSADAYISRGDAYANLGDNAKAVDDYLKAYFIAADNAALCEKLGDAYFSLGIFDNAENYYREAIDLSNGQSVHAYSGLSDAYLSAGDRDAALSALSAGIDATSDSDLSKKYDTLLNNKYDELIASAKAFADAGDFQSALEVYSAAIETSSEMTAAYVGRAACEANLGSYAEACSDYAAAISLGDLSVDNYLAYADSGISLSDTLPEYKNDVVEMLENGYAVTESEDILALLVNAEPSVPAGSYDEVFTLEIDSLCDVHFTTDGSDPDASSPLYSAPIEIGTGDTEIKFITVSPSGIQSDICCLDYNVTTIEMKAFASFEKYFSDHFTDSDQDVFIYDVTGDGLQDMIIVDKTPDDEKFFRVRLYFFDGTSTTPVYLNSKATADNFALCNFDGQYYFLSKASESVTEGNVVKTTSNYLVFRVSETGEEQEVKKLTVKTEGNTVTSSDLDDASFKEIKIIGVPSLLIDAMGKAEYSESVLAFGTNDIHFYNGTFYTVSNGFEEALSGAKPLEIDCSLFLIADETLFYYAKDDTSDFSLYKVSLTDGADATRIGEGDGKTLVYSGGWLYVGDNVRYEAVTGEKKTDSYVNIEKLVYMDGSYIFYQSKLADALTRADRDQFNAVDILAKYDSQCTYFTVGDKLFTFKTDNVSQMSAYTLNGTYVYDTVFDFTGLTGEYIVDGAYLYLMRNNGIVSINLDDGTVVKEYTFDEIQNTDKFLCAGSGKIVIRDSSSEGKYKVVDLEAETILLVEAVKNVTSDNTQP